MHLKKLHIINYKNISEIELEFSPGINCFVGNNGEGKTNLLDAVYYLSFCKSHSNSVDTQNIKHNEDFFVLQGFYERNNEAEEIYCGLKRRQKKQFKRNKKEYERLADHVGFLPLVLVSPADEELISQGSDERRKFIDGAISQYNKEYLNRLIRYKQALAQRNSLLKSPQKNDNDLLDLLEMQMQEAGEYLFEKRTEFVRDFLPTFQQFHDVISLGKEKISFIYESQLQKGNFAEQMQHARERDRILGFSTVGIHKDELVMLLDDYLIRRVGSQGQNKTFLTALKLAQFDFLKQQGGITPILLLDDIFDKLDSERVQQIIHLVSDGRFGQIFITDTNRTHLDNILREINREYRIFEVENGQVQ
jgi:DNA replication and repair protein RecF